MRAWKTKMRRLRMRMMPRLIPAMSLALLLALLVTPAAWAIEKGNPAPQPPGDDRLVYFGEDVHVKAGETVDTVVSFGGDVKVDGTVRNGVYTFGGDLVVGPLGSIGAGVTDKDVTVAVFGGRATSIPGATVIGHEITGADFDWLVGDDGLLQAPFRIGTLGWGLGLAGIAVLGLLTAALLPRQLQAVRAQLVSRPLPSFGWGVLGALVIFPLFSLLLLVTLIGIVLLIPWAAFVIPALCIMGYLGAATLIGERALQAAKAGSDRLWLAVLVGVIILELVTLVPVLGPLAAAVASAAGLGAVLLALRGWWHGRRRSRSAMAPTAPPAVAV